MPWCPQCRAEYRDGFFRCTDCGVPLIHHLPPQEKPEKVKDISADPEGDYPESWARSTLKTPIPVENLVKIDEMGDEERSWLHDALDDHGIPYKVEIIPESYGNVFRLKVRFKQSIYVEEQDRDVALRLVSEFNKEFERDDNIIPVEQDEDNLIDSMDDTMPQITCPACGEQIDFDHAKCPLCKHRLQEL